MFRALVLSLIVVLARSAGAEDVPLERCDRLVVVRATAGSKSLLLLVDTAATSMLNVKSFAHDGDPSHIVIASWNETIETSARQVTIADLVIGEHHLKKLKLPAVDLSALGLACGRKLDGILGTDLLEALNATVDFKNRVARLTVERQDAQGEMVEFRHQFEGCGRAFDDGDEKAFADCLDPQFVLFTMSGDYYGRDAAMDYFRKSYFQQVPLPHLNLLTRAYHPMGDAMWLEYDLSITKQGQVVEARGTLLFRKTGGKWRFLNMNHSLPPHEGQCGQNTSDPKCETTGKNY